MNKKDSGNRDEATALRRRAEKRLSEPASSANHPPPGADLQRLIHELQVHQVELELQNEELRRAQEEIEAGLRRYTDLYDFAPVGYFTLGRDGSIQQANLTGAVLLGTERSRLIRRRFRGFLSPEARPAFDGFLESVFQSKIVQVCEMALQKSGEHSRHVRIESAVAADGEACRAVVADVTDRRQAEVSLRESEERYRRIVNTAHDGIWSMDEQHRTTFVNPAMAAMLGYGVEEMIGESVESFAFAEDLPQHGDEMQARHRGRGGQYERRLRRKDGSEVWTIVSATALTDAQGRFCGSFALFTDITERRQAEKALAQTRDELEARVGERTTELSAANALLRQEVAERRAAQQALRDSHERFQLVCHATRDCIYDWHVITGQVWVNDRYDETLGPTEADGHRWWRERVHPDDQPRTLQSLDEAVQGREDHWEEEYRFRCSDGQYRHILDRGLIVRDASGRATRVIGAMTDVTERKQAEQAAKNAERLASIGTLAAGIAHEINNPVGMILLAAQNAARSADRPNCREVIDRALEHIIEDARRCGRIVQHVLRFARQETLEKCPASLAAALENAVIRTRGYAERCGAQLDLDCPRDLPELPLNQVEIEQACINLIRNAIESAVQGVRVRVRARADGGVLRVAVEDNGRGMSPEERQHVFDPFYTTRQNSGGTGLGLSIVHGIVADHGGNIGVDSEPGRGTIVTIELPIAGCPRRG